MAKSKYYMQQYRARKKAEKLAAVAAAAVEVQKPEQPAWADGLEGDFGDLDGERVYFEDRIPEWFLDKSLDQQEKYAFSVGDGAFVDRVSESGKAVLVKNRTDYGTVSFWMPRSIILDNSKLRIEKEKQAARDKAWDNGLLYNKYLRDTAKANGLKIGNVRRTRKIVEKLEAGGVSFMSKNDYLDSRG